MPPARTVFPSTAAPPDPSFTRGAFTVRRATLFSSLSRCTLYALMARGAIVYRERYGSRRICRASLEAYLRDGAPGDEG